MKITLSWINLLLFFLIGPLHGESVNNEVNHQFYKLYDNPAAIAVTSDYRYFIIADADADKITIFKIGEKEPFKVIKMTSPSSILSRKGKLYIAHGGSGIIDIFSEKSWEKIKEISIPDKFPIQLSAPQGEFFKGTLIVACHSPKSSDYPVYVVNTLKDEIKKANTNYLLPACSYDGKTVAAYSPPNSSRSYIAMTQYEKFINNYLPQVGGKVDVQYMEQFRKAGFWLGGNRIYAGVPPYPLPGKFGYAVINELRSDRFYALYENSIKAFKLNMTQTPLGEWKVSGWRKELSLPPGLINKPKGEKKIPNLAVTFNGTVNIYLYIPAKNALFLTQLQKDSIQKAPCQSENNLTEMHALPLNTPATSMEMSEDGHILFISHGLSDSISVWNVKEHKLITEIKIPAPGNLLSRGQRLFVSSSARNTITVLSKESNWGPVNEFLTGNTVFSNIYAPRRELFKGIILGVSKKKDKNVGELVTFQTLNIHTGRIKKLINNSSDYNPAFFNSKGELTLASPIETDPIELKSRQFFPGELMFYQERVIWPKTKETIKTSSELILVPDIIKKRFYGVSAEGITAFSSDVRLKKIGFMKMKIPTYLAKNRELSIAATKNGEIDIFCLGNTGEVFTCRIDENKFIDKKSEEMVKKRNLFQLLPLTSPASSFSITEDGKYLLISQIERHKLIIWDIENCKVVKEIPCNSPTCSIERNGKIYVSNFSEGTLTVISRKTLKVAKKIHLHNAKVKYLAAPGGSYFKNKIYITYNDTIFHLSELNILTKKEKEIKLLGDSIMYPDYIGKNLILEYGSSFRSISIEDLWKEKTVPNFMLSPYFDYLQQYHPGEFWCGRYAIWEGIPPITEAKRKIKDLALIPDIKRKVFYSVDQKSNTITVKKLANGEPVIFSENIVVPEEAVSTPYDINPAYFGSHNVAVSFKGLSYLFMEDHKLGAIYCCIIDNSKMNDSTLFSDSKKKNSTESGQQLILSPNSHYLYSDYRNQKMFLIDNRKLKIYDADGTTLLHSFDVHKKYLEIRETEKYYIALSTFSIDFLDKKTCKLLASFLLPGNPKSFVIPPGISTIFILTSNNIYAVEEPLRSWKVFAFNKTDETLDQIYNIYGNKILMDPTGKYLCSFLHMPGNKTELIKLLNTNNTSLKNASDFIFTYNIYTNGVALRSTNVAPEGKCRDVTFSPKGKYFAYLPEASEKGTKKSPPKLSIRSIDTDTGAQILSKCDTGGAPKTASCHPLFNLVAASDGEKIKLFMSRTGKEVSGLLKKGEMLKSIETLQFSPNGKNLMVIGYNNANQLVLTSIPLLVKGKASSLLQKGYTPPPLAVLERKPILEEKPKLSVKKTNTDHDMDSLEKNLISDDQAKLLVKKKISARDLESIHATKKTKILQKDEIVKQFVFSVVHIERDDVIGSGFFISSNGYIITSSAIVPDDKRPVSVEFLIDDSSTKGESKAEVIAVDRKKGLTLLKAALYERVYVTIPRYISYKTGADILIIEAPYRDQFFRISLVDGIISNPKRILHGSKFIQINADIKRTTPGAPVFDKKGNVIAVVRGRVLDSIAMATPYSEILEFIRNINK